MLCDAPARLLPLVAALAAWASSAAAQVEVRPLATVDVFTPAAADTGLGADLWKGASAPLVRRMIPQISAASLTPASAMLARRVLATGANAPEGAGSDEDLAGARALALLALGDSGGVARQLAAAANFSASPPLSRAVAESALLAGDDARACAAASGLESGREGPYWLKLRTYCQAIAGDAETAGLTFDLARQAAGDAVFARLMAAKLGGTGAPGAAALRDGLDLALSRSLALDLAPALDGASPAVAAAVARARDLPPRLRRAAAARALRAALTLDDLFPGGALPADPTASPPPPGAPDPRAVDTSVPVETVIRALAAKPGVLAEGDLAGIAAAQADPTLQERAVLALIGRARTPAERAALSRLAAPALRVLARGAADVASPLALAQAAALAGDPEAAAALRARIRGGVSDDDLALLDALIAASGGRSDGQAADRLVARAAAGGPKSPLQAAAVIALSLGAPMSPDARLTAAGLSVPPGAASSARLLLMERAVGAGARGEAALLALSVLTDAGPGGPAPADRARIVGALGRAGLTLDASSLAAEGLAGLR